MRISRRGIDFIKQWEKFIPTIYICQAGWPTIGYGHAIKKGETFPSSITEEEATIILGKDIYSAECSVNKFIKVPLNQNQLDALVSWTFNVGGGALQRSTMRSVLNRQEYMLVPEEIRKWVFAGGRKLKGLIRRREEEAKLFEEGMVYV